jgi:hypothetical protein
MDELESVYQRHPALVHPYLVSALVQLTFNVVLMVQLQEVPLKDFAEVMLVLLLAQLLVTVVSCIQ